eukprot:TRINITY_DN70902_c0_g1_i1.p1 TRINITY_DN70902_c0_g1~~TRINITY_DN70902_c0_g1_i1.p1  ORF type:complete len:140 (+),score=24.26 TRINITY_DN70902_c0_g1_i1:60-479(+)
MAMLRGCNRAHLMLRTTTRLCRPRHFCEAGNPRPEIKLATSEQIPGYTIKEYKGLAIGSTVRTKDMTKDITSAVRAVFGGELPHYTQLMADTREEALERLQDHAAELGANAVVGLRLTSSNIAASASEVMAYGTAVVVE